MPNIQTKDIKNILSKLSMGVEKNNINPSASYIELSSRGEDRTNGTIKIYVSNTDYFLEASINGNFNEDEPELLATVMGDNFINIISKTDADLIDLSVKDNALVLKTKNNMYNFPFIRRDGKVVEFSPMVFDDGYTASENLNVDKDSLDSVAESNVQGLVEATFSKEIQQFIYMDNTGALTFTDNIYINNFNKPISGQFKVLFNATQARLLKIFSNAKDIVMQVFNPNNPDDRIGVVIESISPKTKLSLITQSTNKTNTFPEAKIRGLAIGSENNHAIINKAKLEKALSRLMVFDKKFDITVLDYSKLIFSNDSVELVSVKNHNFERVSYDTNNEATDKYEVIIRFADLVNQLKAVVTDTVDISYGNGRAIVINSSIKQIIPEIKARS